MADVGKTDKSQEWERLWEDWRQKGCLESQKTLPTGVKGLVKIAWKQMRFDITAAGTPPEQTKKPILWWLAGRKS